MMVVTAVAPAHGASLYRLVSSLELNQTIELDSSLVHQML